MCSACGSKFQSDSAYVGIESDAAMMSSVLLNAELGNEDITFLHGHVMLAQSQLSNDESMHYSSSGITSCFGLLFVARYSAT